MRGWAVVLLAAGSCGAAAVSAISAPRTRSDVSSYGTQTCTGYLAVFNQEGESPCEISEQLCQNSSNSTGPSCLCSTIAFNLASVCALCRHENATLWGAWVEQYSCPNNSAKMRYPYKPLWLSSNVDIPSWARIPLKSDLQFDFPEAINTAQNSNWSPTQIVTPIVVAVGVALFAAGAFYFWYRRRRSLHSRVPTPFAPMSFLSLTPSSLSPTRTSPSQWISAHFTFSRFFKARPQSAVRDASWEIDLTDWPSRGSDGSGKPNGGLYAPSEPYLPNPHDTPPQSGRYFPLPDADRVRTPDQRAEGSRARTLLSAIPPLTLPPFPRVPQPHFIERFVKYKGEFRKSPSYKKGQVAKISASERWKIDRSRDSTLVTPPTSAKGEPVAPEAPRCESPASDGEAETEAERAAAEDEMSVLLISRTPGVDFVLSDDGLSSVGRPR